MPKIILGKPVDEEKWKRAKALVAEQGHGDDWDYIVGIYKRLAHLEEKNDIDEISKKVYSKNRLQLTLAKSRYFTTDVRCAGCNRLLFRTRPLQKNVKPFIEIKCKRCGTFNLA